MEQIKPVERWSSEFSYAAGPGIRPHPASSGWAAPCGPGQASVRSHGNSQAVYGGTGPRQHSNRGPNEPPTPLETRGQEKTWEQEKPGLYLTSLEKKRGPWVSKWVDRVEQRLYFFPPWFFTCLTGVVLYKEFKVVSPSTISTFSQDCCTLKDGICCKNPSLYYSWLWRHSCLVPNSPSKSSFSSGVD